MILRNQTYSPYAQLDAKYLLCKIVPFTDKDGNEKLRKVACDLNGLERGWPSKGYKLANVLTKPLSEDRRLAINFSDEKKIVGVDIDKCRNPETGEIASWALEALEQFEGKAIAEISESGTGIKMLFELSDADGRPDRLEDDREVGTGKIKRELIDVESFGSGHVVAEFDLFDGRQNRFFALTQNYLEGFTTIEPVSYQSIFDAFGFQPAARVAPSGSVLSLGAWDVNVEVNEEKLAEILPLLNKDQFGNGNRENWLAVVMAIHYSTQASSKGYDLAYEFSKACGGFDAEGFDIDWHSLNLNPKNPKTLGTIMHFVEQQNPKAFDDISKRNKVEFAGMLTDAEVGRALASLMAKKAVVVKGFDGEIEAYIRTASGILERGSAEEVFNRTARNLIDSFTKELSPSEADKYKVLNEQSKRRSCASVAFDQAKRINAKDFFKLYETEIAAKDCVIDLAQGQVGSTRSFDTENDTFVKQLSVSYDPSAICPEWEQHIEKCMTPSDWSAFETDEEREAEKKRVVERVAYAKRLFGYMLLGTNPTDMYLVALGSGGTGKTTTFSTLQHILGSYAATPDSCLVAGTSEEYRHQVMKLDRARLAVVSEPDTSSKRRFRTENMKELSGARAVSVRGHHKASTEIPVTWKLIIDANKLFDVDDSSDATWRRIKLLKFHHKFAESTPVSEQKMNYDYILSKVEGSGILNWLLEGLEDFYRLGSSFEMPQEYKDELASWQGSEGSVSANRILSRLLRSDSTAPEIKGSELYQSIKTELAKRGISRPQDFYKALESSGLEYKVREVKRAKYVSGLSLVSSDELGGL